MQTHKFKPLVILSLLMLTACASPQKVPVAAYCPPPPPVPEVLKEPVSTQPNLMQRWENTLKRWDQLDEKLRNSLLKAQKA